MKYLCILCFIIVLVSNKLNAGISIPIILSTETNQSQTLTFGLDENATDGIDTSLGEINAPRIPPPDPTLFFTAFVIYDSLHLQELVWSYKDYRPIQQKSHYLVQYHIYVHHGDGKVLYFNWGQLPPLIDSASIIDYWGDLSLVNINMKNKTKDSVTNYFIDDFYISVWYNNPNATFIENIDNDEIFTIYPNPFIQNLILYLKSGTDYNYKIYSQIGSFICSGKGFNGKAELSLIDLNPGIYFVYITLQDGKTIIKKIIKV